jgi:hypothetical protein
LDGDLEMADPGNRYFAYGSNMDTDQMARRGLRVDHAEAAVLHGHRLAFTFDASDRWLGGAADVVPEEGARVEGVLYHLGNEMSLMDAWEGVPEWYRRVAVEVELMASGERLPAWTYEVVDKLPHMPPSEGYAGKMVLAARKFGLSHGYVDSLRFHLACALERMGDHVRVLRTLRTIDRPMGPVELARLLVMDVGEAEDVLTDLVHWGWLARAGDGVAYEVPGERRGDVDRVLG